MRKATAETGERQTPLPGIQPGGRQPRSAPRRTLGELEADQTYLTRRMEEAATTGNPPHIIRHIANKLASVNTRLDRRHRELSRAHHDFNRNPSECMWFASKYAPVENKMQRLVFVNLMAHQNHITRTVQIKGETVARECMCGRRSVWRAVAELEAAGLLCRRRRYRPRTAEGAARRYANEYILATELAEQGRLNF